MYILTKHYIDNYYNNISKNSDATFNLYILAYHIYFILSQYVSWLLIYTLLTHKGQKIRIDELNIR